jgi:hypothetical protein
MSRELLMTAALDTTMQRDGERVRDFFDVGSGSHA